MIKDFEQLKKANEIINPVDIKGKMYATVAQRVKAFRMVCPSGTIKTEMASNNDGICIFRAYIYDEENNLIGTGTAYEKESSSYINKTSYIENCETSAVGRALGFAGFGIDSEICSAEEMNSAEIKQEIANQEDISRQKIDSTKVEALKLRCKSDGVDVDKLCKLYKVKDLSDMTEKQFANANEHWDKIAV